MAQTDQNDPTDQTRRDVLAGTAGFLAAIAGLSILADPARAQDVGRPNILYILADDLGFADVGFKGSEIATPHLDALVEGGAHLTHFYTQHLCTPTRSALMTGRMPMRYGLQTGVIPSGATYGLAHEEKLLPQVLREAGYRTALVGKWHLGHADTAFWPTQRGFDNFYGALVGEIDHFKHEAHGRKDWYRGNEIVVEEGYDTDLFGAEAIRLLEEHDQSAPLFLYLAFTAPHSPYQAPQEWLDRYSHIDDPERQAYAAMISAMDHQIGEVVATLDATGMRENTLIIFHSDNGGTRNKMFSGETAVAGELPPRNDPLREGKGSLYEGGTRVVALANWPGRIAPGEAPGLIHVVDMLPTLAALAKTPVTGTQPLDGMDVWQAVAAGQPSPREDMVYNVEPGQGAIRVGDWKLHWIPTLPPVVELFDLAVDPGETTNLAEAHPEIVADLQLRVVDLARTMAPPLLFASAIGTTFSAPLSTPMDP